MRLMIVDDEDLEHEGLRQMISRLGLDLDVCGDAWDGQEALELAETLRPDIIVTDLRMPVMDGIQFAQKLRVQQPGCFILFISGFEDFQAARDALLIGAIAWLVKPINQEDLRQVLAKICDLAESRSRKSLDEEQRDKRLEVLLPLERQRFLQSLLLGKMMSDGVGVTECAANLGIHLYPGQYAVMVVELQESKLHSDRYMEERLANLAKQPDFPDSLEYVTMPGSRLALVMTFPAIASEMMILNRLEFTTEQLRIQISAMCGACAGMGVSLIGNSPENLAILYAQACAALDDKVHSGRGRVIFYNDNPPELIHEGERITTEQLIKAIEDGSVTRFTQLCDAFLHGLDQCANMQVALVTSLDLVWQLSSGVQTITALNNWRDAGQMVYDRLITEDTIPDLKANLKGLLDSITTIIETRNVDRNEQIVRQVKKIIQKEIGGDLSAEALATRIYLTASHLRRVFRNRVGVTLQDYVLRLRMERARELLGEPGNRVHLVASSVGYESTSYFCMVFRRFFGVSPGEFRVGLDCMDQARSDNEI